MPYLTPPPRECFLRYVHTKAIKRMESFRVRNAAPDHQRKLLLALSFGVSSVTLLHILDCQLKTQTSKTGRTGYGLDVLFVDTSGIEATIPKEASFAKVQEMYPDFNYTSVPLHDVFSSTMTKHASWTRLLAGTDIQGDSTPAQKLDRLFTSLTSATARADVISTLTTRLIVEHARSTGCEGILWGDSTTRLAEKTLSETAKGRGFSLPWQVADGDSPFGLTFNHPLRDILKKELASYVDLVEPFLSSLVCDSSAATQASTSSKNTTIDDLMKQYFESVEENFPSIVSNVVRTTGKLDAPAVDPSMPRCDLCSMPVADGHFGIHGWGGDQKEGIDITAAQDSPKLCYGCTRSIPSPTVAANTHA
jgi:cytoplasmic tRNA 2-thiolation protein 2